MRRIPATPAVRHAAFEGGAATTVEGGGQNAPQGPRWAAFSRSEIVAILTRHAGLVGRLYVSWEYDDDGSFVRLVLREREARPLREAPDCSCGKCLDAAPGLGRVRMAYCDQCGRTECGRAEDHGVKCDAKRWMP